MSEHDFCDDWRFDCMNAAVSKIFHEEHFCNGARKITLPKALAIDDILDIGEGDSVFIMDHAGYLALFLAQFLKASFICSAYTEEAADKLASFMEDRSAKSGCEGKATAVKASAIALPFEEHSMDFVIYNVVLSHYCRNVQRIFEEGYRVLKTGGKMLVFDIGRPYFTDVGYPQPYTDYWRTLRDAGIKDFEMHHIETDNPIRTLGPLEYILATKCE